MKQIICPYKNKCKLYKKDKEVCNHQEKNNPEYCGKYKTFEDEN